MDMMTNPAVRPYLDALRSLTFIQELDFSEQHGKPDLGIDGILEGYGIEIVDQVPIAAGAGTGCEGEGSAYRSEEALT